MSAEILSAVLNRGDLAHLALLLWAASSSGLCLVLVRAVNRSNRRFTDFVNEIAKLNQIFNDRYDD